MGGGVAPSFQLDAFFFWSCFFSRVGHLCSFHQPWEVATPPPTNSPKAKRTQLCSTTWLDCAPGVLGVTLLCAFRKYPMGGGAIRLPGTTDRGEISGGTTRQRPYQPTEGVSFTPEETAQTGPCQHRVGGPAQARPPPGLNGSLGTPMGGGGPLTPTLVLQGPLLGRIFLSVSRCSCRWGVGLTPSWGGGCKYIFLCVRFGKLSAGK